MELDRKELKARAREAIRGAVPSFWVVTLVYFLLTTGVSNLLSLIPSGSGSAANTGMFSLFLSLLISFYTVIIDFGYKLWSLWTVRKLEPGIDSLIQGFSVAGLVLILEFFLFIRLLGITLLLSFTLSFFFLLTMGNPFLSVLLIPLLYGAIFAFMLRYELSHFLLADYPQLGPDVAIHRSVMLMKGWKWELFKLEFSFLGWILLSSALQALGIAVSLMLSGVDFSAWLVMEETAMFQQITLLMNQPLNVLLMNLFSLPVTLWLMPYRSVAKAEFYDARVQLAQSDQMTDLFGPIAPI